MVIEVYSLLIVESTHDDITLRKYTNPDFAVISVSEIRPPKPCDMNNMDAVGVLPINTFSGLKASSCHFN